MESIASDMHNKILHIDCCALLGHSYMPNCVSLFNKLHPELTLRVTISRNSDNVLAALQRKKIDIAILETVQYRLHKGHRPVLFRGIIAVRD